MGSARDERVEDRIRRTDRDILREWRDDGSTEITSEGVIVHVHDDGTRTYMAGTLPDAVALALGLIDIGEQL